MLSALPWCTVGRQARFVDHIVDNIRHSRVLAPFLQTVSAILGQALRELH